MGIKKKYNFEERMAYEETFVNQNSTLINALMGSDKYVDLSRSELDINAGIDGFAQIGKECKGVALRIRKPTYKKYKHRFTLGHHISKNNSQVHAILNSLKPDLLAPNFVLQINGVDEKGYCKQCDAIKIQSDVYAHYLNDLINNNTLQNIYQLNLDAYEFKMQEVYAKTFSGVDYYYIEDNTIIKTYSNDKN